jgi:cytochrome c556
MMTRLAAVVLAVAVSVSCASKNKTGSASTPSSPPAPAAGGTATAGGTAPAGAAGSTAGRAQGPATQTASGGAGAQAAARSTPEQLDAAMKQIAQLNGTLQKNIKSNALGDAVKDAQQLATLFGDVERFFAQNKKADAAMLAQTARTGATDTAGAAGAGDQMKAMTSAANIGGTCKQCHGLYREGDQQSGYRLKAGTITP